MKIHNKQINHTEQELSTVTSIVISLLTKNKIQSSP